MKKTLILFLSFSLIFTYSLSLSLKSSAKGLHFGIISAIEEKIDQLREEKAGQKFPGIETREVSGKVTLPVGSPIQLEELNILSPLDRRNVQEDGEFSVKTPVPEKQQLLIITSSPNPVLLTYVEPEAQYDIEFSAPSTAKALIMMNPLFFLTSVDQRTEIMSKVEENLHFPELVSQIEDLLVIDPENVLNYEEHPEIYKKAAQIAIDVLKEFEEVGLKALQTSEEDKPWIEDIPGDKIQFMNPKCIYYAGAVYPTGSSSWTDICNVEAKLKLWSYRWGWPPVYLVKPTPTDYNLGDNGFSIQMTKGFVNFSDTLSFFDTNSPTGRANLYNAGKVIWLTMDLIGGIPVPFSFGSLHLTIDPLRLAKLAVAYNTGDTIEVTVQFIRIMCDNVDNICYWLLQEASSDAARSFMIAAHGILKNVAVAVNIVTIGEAAANKAIPFVWDLCNAPSPVNYFVEQRSGELTINVETLPPNIPSNSSPPDGSSEQSINVDLYWDGEDPDAGDTVTYDVYLEAGDSDPDIIVSDNQFTTSYDPGSLEYTTTYYWRIIATDNHGAYTPGPAWSFTTSSTEKRVSVDVDTKYWEDGNYELRIIAHGTPGDISSITISGPHIDTATVSVGGGDPHHLYDDGNHGDKEANDGIWYVVLGIVETPVVGETIIFDIAYNDGSSKTKQKSIDGVLSETAQLLSPPDGSTVNTLTPIFEWNNPSVSGLTYSVQVNDTNWNRVYEVYDLPDGTTSHTIPPGYLDWGKTYYWLVSATDVNGNEALSNWDTFVTPL